MSDVKEGERVGALLSAKDKTITLLGYGTFGGYELPPEEINPWLNVGLPNPKILLDNGDTVWGMECWWGPEKKIKDLVQKYIDNGFEVVEVFITKAREDANLAP